MLIRPQNQAIVRQNRMRGLLNIHNYIIFLVFAVLITYFVAY